jgi:hypothetical protein
MWQVMSSRAEVLARAREAWQEKKKKKARGPWGGCVLARAELLQQRCIIARHATLIPPDLLLHVCNLADIPSTLAARATCVCTAWSAVLRASHVFGCMALVVPHVHDATMIGSMSATCKTLARMLAAKRARLHAKAARIRRQNMLQQWLHVRVGVPWDADGDGTVHAGTVMDVRNNGTCLRVELDAGAGKDRLRCKTISVHDVLVLE